MRFVNRSLLPALEGLLLLTILLAGLAGGLSLLVAVTSDSLEEFTIGLPTGPLRDSLPQGVVLDEAEGLAAVPAGLGYRIGWWLVGPASSFIVLAGAEVLRGIVATTRAGAPFVRANVRRIRVLAALTLGYFALTVARSLVAIIIQDDLGLERTSTDISFAPIVSAVVLLALAQIWQSGVKLREEQELTI
jgi:Protein of unknown function (DUF2975)